VTTDFWLTLALVLWKIFHGLVVPMAVIYLAGLGIVWLLKKGGMIDL